MLRLITCLLLVTLATTSFAQNTANEKTVMAFYSGFEKHDWNIVAAQLAPDFTFSSPNNDDHISIERYKERCWPNNGFVKKVNYLKWAQSGNELFLLLEINTTDNKLVRNIDVYDFEGGKIKSIEVFFGTGSKYPGNTD